MKKIGVIALGLFGVVLAALGMIFFWGVSVNNSLVQKDEAVKSAWSQVENVYQRRMDLIPNLVNSVKGYAKHESATLEGVIQARSQAFRSSPQAVSDPKKMAEYQRSQDQLSGAIGRLLVVAEQYPNLKANENFRDLQVQLEGTENRIAVERKRFNEVAQDYNAALRVFPSSLIATFRNFTPRQYFESQAGAATAPKVEF